MMLSQTVHTDTLREFAVAVSESLRQGRPTRTAFDGTCTMSWERRYLKRSPCCRNMG